MDFILSNRKVKLYFYRLHRSLILKEIVFGRVSFVHFVSEYILEGVTDITMLYEKNSTFGKEEVVLRKSRYIWRIVNNPYDAGVLHNFWKWMKVERNIPSALKENKYGLGSSRQILLSSEIEWFSGSHWFETNEEKGFRWIRLYKKDWDSNLEIWVIKVF